MTPTHSPYFFVAPEQIDRSEILLEGDDARHLAKVRRAKPGDIVTVCDGAGGIARVRLTFLSDRAIRGEKLESTQIPRFSSRVCIFQGLAKGEKVDFVVQKLVEIGVDEIGVFLSGRSVPRWDENKRRKARLRWEAVALEAAKQSRRPFLPEIIGPVDLSEAQELLSKRGSVLVAHEQAVRGLREELSGARPGEFALVVGPEGGLEEEEATALAANGKTVSLGRQILRTETAALVAAAILLFKMGRIG